MHAGSGKLICIFWKDLFAYFDRLTLICRQVHTQFVNNPQAASESIRYTSSDKSISNFLHIHMHSMTNIYITSNSVAKKKKEKKGKDLLYLD